MSLPRYAAPASLPPARNSAGDIVPLSLNHQLVPADAAFAGWFVRAPAQYSFEDMQSPALWRKVEIQVRSQGPRHPRRGDLVRVVSDRRDDSTFDAIFTVDETAPGTGYRLQFYCGRPPRSGEDGPA